MGGMQFQTEHHLFPQVPFYRLPSVKEVVKTELAKLGKTIIYGPVI
jgi:fatty acid desaturase